MKLSGGEVVLLGYVSVAIVGACLRGFKNSGCLTSWSVLTQDDQTLLTIISRRMRNNVAVVDMQVWYKFLMFLEVAIK